MVHSNAKYRCCEGEGVVVSGTTRLIPIFLDNVMFGE